MEAWRGKVALVTGASSGIGAAIAVALANAGMQVVAVARRLELVQALSAQVREDGGGSLVARRCDVGVDSEVRELFAHVQRVLGGVDVLVNNAAVLPAGTLIDCSGQAVSMAEIDSLLSVNVRAAIACTRLAVDSMRRRGGAGHLVFINSIAGHYIPQNGAQLQVNAYPASKHAVTALAEVTRLELSHSGLPIRTTSVSPGAVDTDMIRQVGGLPADLPLLQPVDVAAAVAYALAAPPHVNIHEIIIHPTGEKF